MRLNIATSWTAIAVVPAFARGFHVAITPAATRTSTSLATRRSMFPILRRSDLFFPDIDRVFDEMDEMMDSSLATRFPRPSVSLLGRNAPEDLKLKRPLGFEVTQGENEYKVAVHVPDVSAKDIDLQLDHDGRVLRLKGERTTEDGGMKVRSRFEKAIFISPDVDTTKLAANMSGDTLTVVAPKIEKKAPSSKAENKKIMIQSAEPETVLKDDGEPLQNTVEKLKDEKRWPVRDFPY